MSKHWGVIDESSLSLSSPRMIDSNECTNLWKAFEEALSMLMDGAEQVAVVEARYSEKDDCWFEVVGQGCITIDSSNANKWFDDEEDEDE